MSVIRISRPKQDWSVSLATVLPMAWLFRLFGVHWKFTVLVDGRPAGKIGNEQVRAFDVAPGQHRLRMRFVMLRRSNEMRVSLKKDEERVFLCGTSGIGWPTLREASAEEAAEFGGRSVGEPRKPGDKR